MKFYDCAPAPSPRRVRIYLAEKGLEVETVQVDLGNGEQLTESFRAVNPRCTVPVLELNDGTRLASTAGIRRYLDIAYPEPNLCGRTAAEQGRIADLLWQIEADGLMAMSEALRNRASRMQGRALTGPVNYEQIPALAERGRDRVLRFLDGVDAMVRDRPFVAGDTYSVADIDLLVVVDFAGWLKMGLPEGAAEAARWYDAVSSRPSAAL